MKIKILPYLKGLRSFTVQGPSGKYSWRKCLSIKRNISRKILWNIGRMGKYMSSSSKIYYYLNKKHILCN